MIASKADLVEPRYKATFESSGGRFNLSSKSFDKRRVWNYKDAFTVFLVLLLKYVCDFDAGQQPIAKRDASAAAITASALMELAQYTTGAEKEKYINEISCFI